MEQEKNPTDNKEQSEHFDENQAENLLVQGNSEGLIEPLLKYCSDLEDKLAEALGNPESSDEEQDDLYGDYVSLDDGLLFDEYSVEGLKLFCLESKKYLGQLTNSQFKILRSIYPHLSSAQTYGDKVKLLFAGSQSAKDQILRVYSVKVFGTYKVIKIIYDSKPLFEKLQDEKVKSFKAKLLAYIDSPLIALKKIFQDPKGSTDTSAKKIRENLAKGGPLFENGENYPKIVADYSSFLSILYNNPYTLIYLNWKNRYFKHWLYQELFELDAKNLTKGLQTSAVYSKAKLDLYQKMDQIFADLSSDDRNYDKTKNLKKSSFSVLIQNEFIIEAYKGKHNARFEKVRTAEKALLDCLTMNQISALAENMHGILSKLRKENKIKGENHSSAHTRKSDLAAESKVEENLLTASVQIQVTDEGNKKKTKKGSKLLSFLGKMAKIIKVPTKEKLAEETLEPVKPKTIERMSGSVATKLPKVTPDWIGYGKTFKSTVYEVKIPNLIKSIFESGTVKFYVFNDYLKLIDEAYQYYQNLNYVLKTSHKVCVRVDGADKINEYHDEAVYLKLSDDRFIALGKTVFSKTAAPEFYFQIYSKKPIVRYRGVTKKIDFNKQVNGESYSLESIESANKVRSLVIHSFITVLDSLPDKNRNKHQHFLKKAHKYLKKEQDAVKDKRK